MKEMPRWQYWVQDRGGDKNIALMELAACSMISFLVLCALFLYVVLLGRTPAGSGVLLHAFSAISDYFFYEVEGRDHSQVSFLTAVYFLYVLIMVVLFRWTKMARKEKGVYRSVASGVGIVFLLTCLYLAMESHARDFHMRNMANFGVVLSFWRFERSRMINFYFKSFLFRDKQKTGEEIEKSIEEDRERFFSRGSGWWWPGHYNAGVEGLVALFYVGVLMYVSSAWFFGSLQLMEDSSLMYTLFAPLFETAHY